jgi:hypothetical protein
VTYGWKELVESADPSFNLSHSSSVALGKLLNFAQFQFLYLYIEKFLAYLVFCED